MNSSPMDVTRYILRKEGIVGLFRGLTATLARECPGNACFFGGYELTRSFLTNENEKKVDIGRKKFVQSLFRSVLLSINRFFQNMDSWWNGRCLFLGSYVSC